MFDTRRMPIRENVAVIDVGSNSIKLLVAQSGEKPGSLETTFTETVETRISQGIGHQSPNLTETAISAGLKSIGELVRLAYRYQPKEIRMVATSAVREALNGLEFVEKVNRATGLEMHILSGKEEAALIGKGLACDPQLSGMNRFVQMDIGGGSLELVRFDQRRIVHALSLRLGTVRLAEQFVENRASRVDSATESSIQTHVENSIRKSKFDFSPTSDPMVATGGAFIATRAVLAAQVDTKMENSPPTLSINQIATLKTELMGQTLQERMRIPGLPSTRADILPTALITIEKIMQLAGRNQLIHSFYNLRHGVATEMLESLL